MDTKVFYEVIVPLLEVENTALICISTPQDSMNFYSEMFTLKTPDGKPLFNTLEVSLVCAACKASENPERCPHMSDEIPPWKSLAKLDMVKAIYGDKTELLKRESMGVITEDMQSVFREKFVNALFDRPRYTLRKTPLFVFVACDPNGGGDSEMGLVSLVVEYNSIVIVGMDTFCCKGADAIHKLLTAHIERLRAKPELKDAWFIFIPEANLGHEADHMEYMLRDYRKIWTIRDKSRTGVVTTNTRKELYAMETVKYMTQESVHFWRDLVVANPAGTANEEKRCLEEFKKQLMGYVTFSSCLPKTLLTQVSFFSFKRVICHPQRGYSLPKIIYTGKSQGAKDDLVMTLLIGVFWLTEFTCHRVQARKYALLCPLFFPIKLLLTVTSLRVVQLIFNGFPYITHFFLFLSNHAPIYLSFLPRPDRGNYGALSRGRRAQPRP